MYLEPITAGHASFVKHFNQTNIVGFVDCAVARSGSSDRKIQTGDKGHQADSKL